ncbi:MAG: branched-chain amino acid aminotransferase [Alphaproteobacteria bacterium]|nr:branched-chain amino acid aminotransferase [Alphaproteobacteria bacterium]
MSEIIPFDERDGKIWFDGNLVPWRDAKIHVLTHGLHYADAVFEGIRAYNGRIFKLTEHSQRLIKSAEILGFSIPYSLTEINEATLQVMKTQTLQDCYIRPVAWRGSEMMGVSGQANKVHVAIAVWEWKSYFSPELKAKGIRLNMAKWRRPSPETAPTQSKASGLYMIATMSKHDAEKQGYADALMLDYRGYIAESTGANIFFRFGDDLHTPIADCFLDGITRRTVIELAKKRGIKVIERYIKPEELEKAEEAFLTGTAAEVTPIGSIGSYRFTVGSLTHQLMEDYNKLVRSIPSTVSTAA